MSKALTAKADDLSLVLHGERTDSPKLSSDHSCATEYVCPPFMYIPTQNRNECNKIGGGLNCKMEGSR